MYFTLTQLLDPFPLLLLALGISLAWAILRGRLTIGQQFAAGGTYGLLVLVSLPATAYLAAASLERSSPRRLPEEPYPIVVLGGYLDEKRPDAPFQGLGHDSMRRAARGAQLYFHRRDRPQLVLCGGKIPPDRPGPSVARGMADFLQAARVPPERLVLEADSTTTHENALYAKRLFEAQNLPLRCVLVTDAIHLRRAAATFRKQGFEVVVCGCDYRSQQFVWELATFTPGPTALRLNQRVTHEWLGNAWYWLRGKL